MRRIVYTILFTLTVFAAHAQQKDVMPATDTTDLSDLSLEQLKRLKSKYAATDLERKINLAIEAASRNPMSLRKSPSIISVITEDEIRKSGAKTLLDVLRLVPGMDVNVDVQGVLALSFRGLSANEGNLMLQIDGFEFNETAYNGLQFGNHYPITDIRRIEVIRGPGSAIYGGTAEFAVINIMTLRGNDIEGVKVGAAVGQTRDGYSQQNVNWALGNRRKNLTYSLTGFAGRAQTSHADYKDVYGNGFSMNGNSPSQSVFLNGSLNYKDWGVKLIYDDYKLDTRDGYQAALSKPYPNYFSNIMGDLRRRKVLSEKVTLNTRLSYRQCVPWANTMALQPADTNAYIVYKIKTERIKLNANVNWDYSRQISLAAGVEGYYDRGKKYEGDTFKNVNSDVVYYYNYAPYFQLLLNSYIANVTVGARYDFSNAYGSAFNPRLGVTRKVGNANFKALFASSFRAPSIENINYSLNGVQLKPEQSRTFEFEASYKLSRTMFLSANVFDITTINAIKYFVRTDSFVSGGPDGYRNSPYTGGTRGLELEYLYLGKRGYLAVNYSYYTAAGKQTDSLNSVPLNTDVTLGIAPRKFSISGSVDLGRHFFISPSVQYMSRRYAVTAVDTALNAIFTRLPAQVIFNFYAGTNTLIPGFNLGIGVKNITDEKILYPQTYNSLHAPLPGMGREFYIIAGYTIKTRHSSDTVKK